MHFGGGINDSEKVIRIGKLGSYTITNVCMSGWAICYKLAKIKKIIEDVTFYFLIKRDHESKA